MGHEKHKLGTRTVIFGAGTDCERLLQKGLPGENVVALIDNDPAKHGSTLSGHSILPAAALGDLMFDRVRIATSETPTLRRQLLEMGVPEEKLTCPLLESENRRRLASLRGQHAGRTAVIVGNGPSLRIADLDELARHPDVVKFAFNKIYLAYERSAFRPDYFMVEDFLVAENNAATLNALRGTPKLYRDTLLRWLEPDEDTILFGMTVLEPEDGVIRFSDDPLEFFWGASVTYTAIQLAFYMGFADVYLIGIDFTFTTPTVDAAARVFRAGAEQNHFLPEYRQPGERWNRPRPEVTQAAFEAALAAAQRTGRRIFNATRGGALEVFPRVSFDEVFAAR